MKILILLPHPIESPGPRFRIYQYLPYFKEAGIEYKISTFLNSAEYMNIYNGPVTSFLEKLIAAINGISRQIHAISDIKSYDGVIVYREAILFGRPWIESYISNKGIPIIFDFDDAIWMYVKSQTGISPILKRLLKPKKKFDDIIQLSTHIFAGNNYLARHAKLLNKRVSVIPTVVNTDYYKPTTTKQNKNEVVIGWIGSGSTSVYLKLLDNIWKRLSKHCRLKVIGGIYNPEGIQTTNMRWSLDTELAEMAEFDIGIMPLPDDEWAKGKCGLKVLQYMAMEIPCVASPVGVNTDIIQDGVNGFLAKTEEEWVGKLTLLIENPELRNRIGRAGRKTVEEQYSVKVWAPRYMDIIQKVANKKIINSKSDIHDIKINYNLDEKVVIGFGKEWDRFDQSQLNDKELYDMFSAYFTIFPWDKLPKNSVGFDLGCGSGRWAKFVATKVGNLHCIDPSEEALRVAERTLKGLNNCSLYKASVDNMPLDNNSMDFGYSIGVLHHVPDTEEGIKMCVAKLKKNAPFLLYLYYAFDNKPFWYRMIWKLSDGGRLFISRMPFPLKYISSQIIALFIYLPLARFAKLAELMGLQVDTIPLSFYRNRNFYTMRTDALDRFGTKLEKRFTKAQILKMMEHAGLMNIKFSDKPPYWCAVGEKS